MQTLIKNTQIIDGTGHLPFMGDILVCDGVIASIAEHLDVDASLNLPAGDVVINAQGLYVTPGFIDIHSHTDLANFLPEGLAPKIMQGVTTEVVGQCGLSVAPMSAAKQKGWQSHLIIGNLVPQWGWSTMREYLQELEKQGLESNLLPFVGHGTLRFAIALDQARPLTKGELALLTKLIDEAFDAGVFGVSIGLIYIPAVFANSEELRCVAESVARRGGILAVHMRSESDELIEALSEMVALSATTGCKLHVSHLKAIGERNWHKLSQALKIIEKAQVTFDHYPYTAGSTSLLSIFPPCMFQSEVGAASETVRSFSEPRNRQRIKSLFAGREQLSPGLPWDNLPSLLGWKNIIITSAEQAENLKYIGRNLQEIADDENRDPTDVVIDLVVKEGSDVRIVDYHSNDESIITKLRHPLGMIGTDTLLGGKIHPRVTGTYPKIFRQYVFEQPIISIENAVAQMTARPARVLGLSDRGFILPGYKADLVFFDRTFSDCSTFAEPNLPPKGLQHVMINGRFKVKAGQYQSEVRSGMVLKDGVVS